MHPPYLIEQADPSKGCRLGHAASVHVRERVREKAGHVQAEHLRARTAIVVFVDGGMEKISGGVGEATASMHAAPAAPAATAAAMQH